jgi:hypothetical protein
MHFQKCTNTTLTSRAGSRQARRGPHRMMHLRLACYWRYYVGDAGWGSGLRVDFAAPLVPRRSAEHEDAEPLRPWSSLAVVLPQPAQPAEVTCTRLASVARVDRSKTLEHAVPHLTTYRRGQQSISKKLRKDLVSLSAESNELVEDDVKPPCNDFYGLTPTVRLERPNSVFHELRQQCVTRCICHPRSSPRAMSRVGNRSVNKHSLIRAWGGVRPAVVLLGGTSGTSSCARSFGIQTSSPCQQLAAGSTGRHRRARTVLATDGRGRRGGRAPT